MKTCNFCGKKLNGKQKKYCSKQCGKKDRKNKTQLDACKTCGNELLTKDQKDFCSLVCAGKAITQPRRGLEVCKNCNKKLIGSQRKFCSHSCAAAFNNKGIRRHGKPPSNCFSCGKKLKSYKNKYCNGTCQSNYNYKQYIKHWLAGEESGIYNGKVVNTSVHVKRWLIESYGECCQLCNWAKISPKTGKIPIQLHHVDGDCTNGKPENLIYLCPNCHSLTDTFGVHGSGKGRQNRAQLGN